MALTIQMAHGKETATRRRSTTTGKRESRDPQ